MMAVLYSCLMLVAQVSFYRITSLLFVPHSINWFQLMFQILIILFCVVEIVASWGYLMEDTIFEQASRSSKERSWYQTSIYMTSSALYFFFFLLQIFEWVIYANFVNFQGKYRLEELEGRQKEFNKREKWLTYFFIVLALLITLIEAALTNISKLIGTSKEPNLVKGLSIGVESILLLMVIASELYLESSLKKHYKV